MIRPTRDFISTFDILFLPNMGHGSQSAISSQMMMERQTSSARQGSRAPDSTALIHVITPGYRSSIHVSILPSFLSRLPLSIHTLQVSCTLPRPFNEHWKPGQVSSKLSYCHLNGLKMPSTRMV
ncbi:hypothetical protein BT69DRAFT_1099497 [Atractiella rhizophila]|nr:hypothetical protein BT69DRAFT_1099497 [Atractiella rhizophila]